jgi:hypothetical protein
MVGHALEHQRRAAAMVEITDARAELAELAEARAEMAATSLRWPHPRMPSSTTSMTTNRTTTSASCSAVTSRLYLHHSRAYPGTPIAAMQSP